MATTSDWATYDVTMNAAKKSPIITPFVLRLASIVGVKKIPLAERSSMLFKVQLAVGSARRQRIPANGTSILATSTPQLHHYGSITSQLARHFFHSSLGKVEYACVGILDHDLIFFRLPDRAAHCGRPVPERGPNREISTSQTEIP